MVDSMRQKCFFGSRLAGTSTGCILFLEAANHIIGVINMKHYSDLNTLLRGDD